VKTVKRKKPEEFENFLKKCVGTQICEIFACEEYQPSKERKLVTFVSDKLGQCKSAFKRFCNVARLATACSSV